MARCLLPALAACSTNTEGLERQAPSPEMPGSGGVAAVSSSSGGTGGAPATSGSGGSATEAGGPARIGLLHGLVDRPFLFFCRDVSTRGEEPPQPPGGIPYGGHHSIETDWDLAESGAELSFVAGSPESIEGRGCAELLAAIEAGRAPPSPPPAPRPDAASGRDAGLDALDAGGDSGAGIDAAPDGRAQPPPSFPESPAFAGALALGAGLLAPDARYALVVAGCADPGAVTDRSLCGPELPVIGGRASTLLVGLPGLPPPDSPGLQFLNASRAVVEATVTLQREQGGARPTLATDVGFGALRPRIAIPLIPLAGAELSVVRGSPPAFVQPWGEIQPAVAEAGRNYVLCYVGPDPTRSGPPRGNPATFALLPGVVLP